jgi:hypothetical protein
MNPQREPRFGPGKIMVLIAIGVAALIFVTGYHSLIFEKLYSGYAFFIIVVIVVEYLLLKGADRSDMYRRELEAAREKRRDDLLALREIETRLAELQASLLSLEDDATDMAQLRSAINATREANEDLLRRIGERI